MSLFALPPMTTKAILNKPLMFSPQDVRSASPQTNLKSRLCVLEKKILLFYNISYMLWCESLWLVFSLVTLVFCEPYLRYHGLKLRLVNDQVAARLHEMIALPRSPTQLCWRDLISHGWCHAIINGCNSIVGKLHRGNCYIALFNWVIIVFIFLYVLPFVPVCTGAQQNQPKLNFQQQTIRPSGYYFVWGRCVRLLCHNKAALNSGYLVNTICRKVP